MEPQGGFDVVKGVSHRVIVVKSPDKYFEEAIFVIREDVLRSRGASSEAVLKEARRIANSYVSGRNKPVKRNKSNSSFMSKLPPPFFVAAGAAAAGVAWLALHLCGV
ncbi:MAG: translation initiation factor 2 [Firmicutes bacterium HGW-Firmicutes-16]|nr:MAG: translation initiation factor 2 [Firmicutes bacterium HGW-Firmicutes-16]